MRGKTPHRPFLFSAQGGHTLLHFAAGFEQLPVAALLLERGAALELRDKARFLGLGVASIAFQPVPRADALSRSRVQWGKAPVDWALQAEAHAAAALLQRTAAARGCGSGRGEVAPLATCTEHHHGRTNEEMAHRLAAVTAAVTSRLAKAEKSDRERGHTGTGAAVRLPYDADSVRARLAAVRAAAAAQVAPHRL